MKIDVLCRFTGRILYSHDAENNTLRLTLEAAVRARAYLADANLADANLAGADLAGAYLARAYLADANLADANLAGADLAGANLAGANLADANLAGANLADADLADAYLAGANLADANLAGANLADANLARAYLAGANLADANLARAKLRNGEVLTGERPVVQVGPIGSRDDHLVAYVTDQGLRFDAGCQRQISRDLFESRIDITHGTNKYAQEYRAALAFIDAHAAIWGS